MVYKTAYLVGPMALAALCGTAWSMVPTATAAISAPWSKAGTMAARSGSAALVPVQAQAPLQELAVRKPRPLATTESQTSASPKELMAQCMRDWDAATHMTRQEWARTCRRVQNRLDNIGPKAGQLLADPRQRSVQ